MLAQLIREVRSDSAETPQDEVAKRGQLRRHLPVAEVYEVHGAARQVVVSEKPDETAQSHILFQQNLGLHDDPKACQCCDPQRLAAVDREPSRDSSLFRRATGGIVEAPATAGVAEYKAIMSGQIVRCQRRTACAQVGWRSADPHAIWTKRARDQPALGQFTHSDRRVEAFLHQIHDAIVQGQFNAHRRMDREEFAHCRRQLLAAEGKRRRDPQPAAWSRLARLDPAVCVGDQPQNRPALLIIDCAGLRQALSPCGAVEQPRPQTLLKRAQMIADHRRRQLLPLRGSRDAAKINHLNKNGHAAELIHSTPMLRNEQTIPTFITLGDRSRMRPHILHERSIMPDIKDRFVNRTALVTGGGSGMRKAAALRLAREGANVVVAGRRPDELAAVVREITERGGRGLAVPTDIADRNQVEGLVTRTIDAFGALHLAWNNASQLGGFLPLHEASMENFDTVIGTNLRGVYACLKFEIAAMLQAGTQGAIVNTSSWTAAGAMPGLAAYAATKAGLEALARTVAVEVGHHGIRINNVSPGIIATPMASGVLASETAARPFLRHTPLQRIGTAEEVADAVLWLLSDDARFVTGQSIVFDGGFTIGGLRPWLNDIIGRHST